MLHIISSCDHSIIETATAKISQDDDVVIFADMLTDEAFVSLILESLREKMICIVVSEGKQETQTANFLTLPQNFKIIDVDTFVALSVKHASIITWQ